MDLYYFNARHHPKKSAASERYAVYVEKMLKAFETAANGMINLHIIDPGDLRTMPTEPGYTALTIAKDSSVSSALAMARPRDGWNPSIPTGQALLEYEISTA